MKEVREVNDNELEELIQNPKKVLLVDFFATWCGPCKMFAPVLQQLQNECEDWLEVVKVDVDKSGLASSEFGVESIPTLILFDKDGSQVDDSVGYKTLSQLKEFVEQYK